MDKKTRFRAGLTFGITMAAVYIVQNLIGNDDRGTRGIIIAIGGALVAGALAGIVFGWVMWRFSNSKKVNEATKIETADGESILFETPANHVRGIEGVGGKLYLTNMRLVFKSHKLNFQNHKLSINLNEIRNFRSRKFLGIINNGLLITTNQNKTEKFAVEKPAEWVNQLLAIKPVN